MSSGTGAPQLSRRTITLDETKVVKEVVEAAPLRPITSGRSTISDGAIRTAIVESPPPLTSRNGVTSDHRPAATPTSIVFASDVGPAPRSSESTIPLTTIIPDGTRKELPQSSTVLVINASQCMAQEITVELSSTLPGCTILFAPTLSLALWILKRRKIDLILSSAILPDGALATLHEFIELMSPPPELVVLSNLHSSRAEFASHPGYRFVELRRVSTRQQDVEPQVINSKISALGADIRNDLNNPLQEIVAMAFVAHASEGLSPMAEEALSAIQRAAGNMADVVNNLENKIRGVVS